MLLLLYRLIQWIQPLIVPVCFVFAWLFIITLVLTIYHAIRDATKRAEQMHQIPCSNCRFFTNDYRLKCTIQPIVANTEQAINCRDYQPR